MKKSIWILSLVVVVLLASCGKQEDVVRIKTSYGEMVAILYDETPLHKKNFLKLIDSTKYYDSTLFHRVMEGFMIQGGDPDSKHAQPGQPLGQGGPGYEIPAEIDTNFYHVKGALAAARLSDQQNPEKKSSGSQFYIVLGTKVTEAMQKIDQQKLSMGLQQMYMSQQFQPMFDSLDAIRQTGNMEAFNEAVFATVPRVEKVIGSSVQMYVPEAKLKAYSTVGGVPFLDGNYTVFGQVVGGLDVIDKIAAVQKDQANRPLEDIRMTVTHEKMSRSKIEKEFGYKFPSK
jgi:peptidyl-prolyl cis-trans isomerase B (cyclophilin B)